MVSPFLHRLVCANGMVGRAFSESMQLEGVGPGTMEIFWNQIVGKVDPAISLGVTLSIIAAGVFVSLWKTRGTAMSLSASHGPADSPHVATEAPPADRQSEEDR